MTRTRASLLFLVLALAPAPYALASQTNAGVDTSQFLLLGAGARSLGMGEAFGPIAEGPEALYWNPAGLAQTRSAESSYTHMEVFSVFHYDYIAHAQPVAWLGGTLGFSYARLAQDPITVVSNANVPITQFTPQSNAFSVGYAHSFSLEGGEDKDRDYFREAWEAPGSPHAFQQQREPWAGTFMVGLALKGISESLYDHTANAVALDGGILFRPASFQQLSLSAAFQNAFGQEKFDQENFLLPVQFSVGAAYDQRWWQSRLLPAVELVMPYFGNPYAKVGIEYSKPVTRDVVVAMRAGFKTLTVSDLNAFSGVTCGLGLQYRKLSVDFGFEPMADLGEMYRFTAGWKW